MAVAAKAPQAFVALLAPEKYLNSCSREIVVESGKPSIPIHQLKYETLFGRDGRYGMFPYHKFPQPMRERLQRLFASAIEKAKNAQVEDPEATLFVKSYAEIMAMFPPGLKYALTASWV